MHEEVLTLVRELKIVRDENLTLQERLDKLYVTKRLYEFEKKSRRLYGKMNYQLKFMSGSHNPLIAERCQSLVDDFTQLQEDRRELIEKIKGDD